MPLRIASTRDLPSIAAIFAAAFWHERIIGEVMHPYRENFPNDFRRFWRHQVEEWYWNYSHQLVVAYTVRQNEMGQDEEVLTGVADWIRFGKDCERLWDVWGWWDLRKLSLSSRRRAAQYVSIGNSLTKLVATRNRLSFYWLPNRAADPAMAGLLSTVYPLISHLWSGQSSTGWYLNFLGVDPAHQRQGYGRLLVTWGVERAMVENLAVSVISGEGRDDFYRRCGFDVEVGRATEGKGNPLKDKTTGGAVLFRFPAYDPDRTHSE
ncbi:MAG: hypothetical protein LQ343_005811 [Gyalolechia ehrenbergii]|nr:MAG: hypothetical protein LQ343_005811 [Gyalolechia ehrenbergii]